MLLSFSVPEMLPMIARGIAQVHRAAEEGRVKRQTIRRRGLRAELLIERASEASWTIPYDLHCWWKSRTPDGYCIGVVPCQHVRVYPITILHSSVEPTHAPDYPCLRINGPRGWRDGDDVLFWSPSDGSGIETAFGREAFADGFDSVEAFRDFFVPNLGDRFEAILFKW